MWRALLLEGISIGREQTARLMRLAGVRGKSKGRTVCTTQAAKTPETRPDLVERDFTGVGPNQLWVADITYVETRVGFVYTAFVTDVFSRAIVGWAVSETMKTEQLPLVALNQATRAAQGGLQDLIHHADHGSQYVSTVYGTTLAEAGIASSTGSVGDSYDNALAESVNSSYKNELITNAAPWADAFDVEAATFQWVHWWNNKRLHQGLGYQTPAQVQAEYWQTKTRTETIQNKANA